MGIGLSKDLGGPAGRVRRWVVGELGEMVLEKVNKKNYDVLCWAHMCYLCNKAKLKKKAAFRSKDGASTSRATEAWKRIAIDLMGPTEPAHDGSDQPLT